MVGPQSVIVECDGHMVVGQEAEMADWTQGRYGLQRTTSSDLLLPSRFYFLKI